MDFDRRAEDKTTSCILILGNSGQGKSYLMKLLLTNLREAGKRLICLDAEAEYEELTENLGGCYIDFMSGEYTINCLEPKAWTDGTDLADPTAPEAFRRVTRLSQHVAFLKDFFRSYKDFTDAQIDTIEILLMKLYARFGIDDTTDYSQKKPEDFPILSDFSKLCEEEFMTYDKQRKYLYTEELLQEVCLGIHSMCVGAESKYFNGHTNITDDAFLCFGVKGLMDTNRRLKDAMLFNILSYMSNELLGKGNTMASIDELYLFLTNMTAIEYIRNAAKRARKKESGLLLASQNIEDFLIKGSGTEKLPVLSFESPGVHTYTISQIKGSNSQCSYDETVYTMKVYVTNNENGPGLVSEIVLTVPGMDGKPEHIIFVNKYPTVPDDPDDPDGPQTGDSSHLWLYICLGAVSLTALVTLFLTKRRKSEQ